MMGPKSIVIPEGKICDYIDGRFRNDTPEEYVRQTIEKRLINEHKYHPKQVRIEYALQLGSRKPRADIVIFERDCMDPAQQTQERIKTIIECKKEAVDARNAKDGVEQLKSYMSACPNCEWGMWTNGKQKEVFRKCRTAKGSIDFLEYNDIPSSDGNLEDINRPKRTSLKNAYDDNLLFVFKTCHNHIHVNDGLQKQAAFFELLKVIFCKIEDERNIPAPLSFYTTSEERSNPDGQLTVKKRISKIFDRVKKKHGKIFDANDEIKLSPRSLAYIVSELQKYSLLSTNIDIKGKAYEEIVGANLRGDRGEFFTPRNVMKMVVEMINPKVDEKVLDSSCGTGGFLVTAMTHVMGELEREYSKQIGRTRKEWDSDSLHTFQDRISEMAAHNYFGFDINPDLVKATKMNMVMNNDGSGNILQTNSLLPPHEWNDEFKSKLADALGISPSELRNHATLGYFDVIVTNPPFGSKIPVKDKAILEQFELAHIWENDKKAGTWTMTPRLQLPVKWCSVPLEDVLSHGRRLDASVFDIAAKQAWETISKGKYASVPLYGNGGLIKVAYYPGWIQRSRLKRIYCDRQFGEGFYLPSQMTDIYPVAEKYISRLADCDMDELRLKRGTLLLTRSGTIGSVAIVSDTLDGKVFSDDVIRITFKEDYDLGYVYAFLKSKVGNLVLCTNGYGSVITHIEPAHLEEIKVPDAPVALKKRIHELIAQSYALRDESNSLIDKATALLVAELHLPKIWEFERDVYKKDAPVETFSVKLRDLAGRADASYHVPIVGAIVKHLKQYAEEVTTVGDSRISKDVILPPRFARIYVNEGYGKILIGGKQIYELDPTGKKYLSNSKHKKLLNFLEVHPNTVLITRSGTIGKVAFVPKHWENWIPSDHIIRVVPNNDDVAGYLYVFLASSYGDLLITRYTYGSVVDEIDDAQVRQIPIPLLKNKLIQQKINDLALSANATRYEAYELEQQALRIMDDEVLYAK